MVPCPHRLHQHTRDRGTSDEAHQFVSGNGCCFTSGLSILSHKKKKPGCDLKGFPPPPIYYLNIKKELVIKLAIEAFPGNLGSPSLDS